MPTSDSIDRQMDGQTDIYYGYKYFLAIKQKRNSNSGGIAELVSASAVDISTAINNHQYKHNMDSIQQPVNQPIYNDYYAHSQTYLYTNLIYLLILVPNSLLI